MTNTTTTKAPSLTIDRTFKAPIARVFDAFSNADTMGRWMGPPGSEVTHCAFEARVGGSYRVTFKSPNYGEMTAKGKITAITSPSHIAYTWEWEEADPKDVHVTNVTIDFVDKGTETEMHFVHEGFLDEQSRDQHLGGWNGALTKIDAVLTA